ncbi:MAG: TIGR04282 family arsenosugar biosynthesis glycosyltransferase [Planctomycetaceae bacterium]
MNQGNSIAVAIFVKTPGLSPVKSRLAAEIGVEQAERCYRLSLQAVAAVVERAKEISSIEVTPYWAVAEPEGMSHPLWQDFDRLAQPAGDLGERLAGVYDQLIARHRGVMFLGADLPQITAELLLEAMAEMSAGRRFVIGPADDGGFYLFGGTTPLPADVWTSVVYSSKQTCEQLCGMLQGRGEVVRLKPLRDIDHLDDLKAVIEEFHAAERRPAAGWLKEQRIWCEAFEGF